MGTANWTISDYANDDNKNLTGTRDRDSNATTTSGTAANISGLTVNVGEVLSIDVEESHWIRFGGRAAVVGSGFHLLPSIPYNFEISVGDEGTISLIEG